MSIPLVNKHLVAKWIFHYEESFYYISWGGGGGISEGKGSLWVKVREGTGGVGWETSGVAFCEETRQLSEVLRGLGEERKSVFGEPGRQMSRVSLVNKTCK